MPSNLRRFHQSGQSHFVTFSCYRRRQNFITSTDYDLFLVCLKDMRRRFALSIYGYVVMPEHVHLLLSEPKRLTLADAVHYLKLSFVKRLRSPKRSKQTVTCGAPGSDGVPGSRGAPDSGSPIGPGSGRIGVKGSRPPLGVNLGTSFWQQRYYDRNVRDWREFEVKLRYLHRNPVKRGLVDKPEDWKWSSLRHYALREKGRVEIESEWTARDRELAITGGPARTFLSPG